MIRSTDNYDEVVAPRGGAGVMERHIILTPAEMYNANTMFGKLVLRPGAAIGHHQHVGDTEAYYILEGTGLFKEDDLEPAAVKAGDICYIEEGHSHSLSNPGDKDLVFIALMYKVQK